MTVLAVILGIASLLLLFLFLMQKREIKSMAEQLHAIGKEDTNELVHSESGGKASGELTNEINALLKETRRMRMEYQQKKHELNQMMTNISHDLRTPLTSAMGYVGMLQNSGLPQAEKERGTAIVEQRLRRLEELLDSFFEFSKIISGDGRPDREELNLVALLEESVVHYYDDFTGQEREILLHCDKPKRNVLANRNMLLRIFDNLISNAFRHGAGNLSVSVGGTETVRVRFENDFSGPDMDENRIFDEFYTTDISRSKGGTGLGLAIAKQFTQMLGGTITAEYDGRTFDVTVEFPET